MLLHGVVPDRLLLMWLALITVQAGLAFGEEMLLGTTSARVVADLGSRVYDHLQSLPLSWHQERKRGEILALLVNDVWRINGFLTGVLAPLLPLLVTCVGALVLLVRIELWVGLAVAVGVPLFTVVVKLLTRELRPLAQAHLREDAVKYGMAEQALATLPLIKAYTREVEESARYSAQGDKVRALEVRQLRIESMLAPAVRWLAATVVLGLLWVGSQGVASGAITAAELVSLLLYGDAVDATGQPAGRGLRPGAARARGCATPDGRDVGGAGTGLRRARARSRQRLDRFRIGGLCVPRPVARLHRSRPGDPCGRDGRHHRCEWRRQDHDRAPVAAIRRPVRRPDHARRHRRARFLAAQPAVAHRAGQPARAAAQRHGCREHRLRSLRSRSPADRARVTRRTRSRVHRTTAAGLRHADRRRGVAALGWATPADQPGPRAAERPGDPGPGRGHGHVRSGRRAGLHRRVPRTAAYAHGPADHPSPAPAWRSRIECCGSKAIACSKSIDRA